MDRALACVALAVFAASCQSVEPARAEGPAGRAMLDAVKSLEGTWSMPGPEGQEQVAEFRVSSGGSVVRELMFPGQAHEMTNMYALDGDALLVTHYCAGGNQPRMRATSLDGNKIVFARESVTGLDPGTDAVMAEMTLELVDRDHFVEHWRAFAGDVPRPEHEQHFAYARRK